MQSAQICAQTQKFECNTDEGGTATLEVTQQENLASKPEKHTHECASKTITASRKVGIGEN